MKMHITESRFATGPSDALSDVSTFQPGNITGWGSQWATSTLGIYVFNT